MAAVSASPAAMPARSDSSESPTCWIRTPGPKGFTEKRIFSLSHPVLLVTQANTPKGGYVATYIKMLTATGLACTVLGLSGCGSDSQASSGNGSKPTLSIQ